jgi:O-antigen/teichoic acid export membrane protein
VIFLIGTLSIHKIIKTLKFVRSFSRKPALWVLIDQGVVSLGNFLTNILIARNLPQSEYGTYVLIYGVLIFLNSLHSSLIIYPLSVKGAIADEKDLRRLTGDSLVLTTILWLFLSLVVVAASAFIHRVEIAPMAICALWLWQNQESVRRSLMSHLRYAESVWGDSLSYLGQAGLVWFLAQQGHLSVESAFITVAVTSGIAAITQLIQLKAKPIPSPQIWHFATTAWDLGRWSLLSNLATIFNIHAPPWVLTMFHGTGEVASLQAINNILGSTNPILQSTPSLIIPSVAKARLEGKMPAVWQVVKNYTAQGLLFLLPIYGFILVFPRKVIELLYGSNSPYLEFEQMLRLVVLVYGLVYFSQVVGATLQGLEENKSVFLAQCASITSAVFFGLPLAAWVGALGAIIGSIISGFGRVTIGIILLRKIQNSQKAI